MEKKNMAIATSSRQPAEKPPNKFRGANTFVPDTATFVGKNVHEVIKHLTETYKDYYIPDVAYWDSLHANPETIPEELRDGKYYFIPILIFRLKAGHFRVHFGGLEGTGWQRHPTNASSKWQSFYRVILLEK